MALDSFSQGGDSVQVESMKHFIAICQIYSEDRTFLDQTKLWKFIQHSKKMEQKD